MSKKLNYYRDSAAHEDEELCPAERKGELCLHCNKDWNDHSGWKCLNGGVHGDPVEFDDCHMTERYLTPTMSLGRHGYLRGAYAHLYNQTTGKPLTVQDVRPQAPPAIKQEVSFTGPDLSDWKTWARVPAGYCACNIPQHQCPDHKEAKKPKHAHL